MEAMSSLNLRRAADYREEVLARRRRAFYRQIRELTSTATGQARKRPVPRSMVPSGTSL